MRERKETFSWNKKVGRKGCRGNVLFVERGDRKGRGVAQKRQKKHFTEEGRNECREERGDKRKRKRGGDRRGKMKGIMREYGEKRHRHDRRRKGGLRKGEMIRVFFFFYRK